MSTSEWIAKHDKVLSVTALASPFFSVERTLGDTVLIAVISVKKVDEAIIQDILENNPSVAFVCNTQKETLITGAALALAEANETALGDGGDLFAALPLEEIRFYQKSETSFVLRSLRQHTKVRAVHRLNNRLYRLERTTLPDVTVLVLNEYEISVDTVRTALDKFGHCQAIVRSNPNGGFTTAAEDAIRLMGLDALSWSELMGNLNHRWK